jgi:hypothetical protein
MKLNLLTVMSLFVGILVVSWGSGSVVQAQCMAPSFAAPADVTAGSKPYHAAVADFNGDGRADIALSNPVDNTVSLLLGDGGGGFSAPTTIAAGTAPTDIAVGDFNGDNNADIVVTNDGTNNVSVLLGNGSGVFAAATTVALGSTGMPPVPVSSPSGVAVGDINKDGRADLVVSNGGTRAVPGNTVSVLLGNGMGGFAAATTFTVGTLPTDVALADFNGDGNLDLATTNERTNNISVRLGDGAGGFGANTNFAVGNGFVTIGSYPNALAVADINGDNRLDIVTANAGSNNMSVLLGRGNGAFVVPPLILAMQNVPSSVALVDVNRDGRLDAVTTNQGSDSVSIRLGDGFGNFGATVNTAVGNPITPAGPAAVAVGDFNGDGKPDLVVTRYLPNNLAVLLNTCP